MAKKQRDFDYRIASKIFTKEQLGAIGSVVLESTFLEEEVESLIWALAKLEPGQGKFFTFGMQMGTRLDTLASLGMPLLRSASRKAELASLISRMKVANTARNVIVHGNWRTTGVGVLTVLMEGTANHPPATVSKRGKTSSPATKTAAEIEDVALDLAELHSELVAFSRSWRCVPSLQASLKRSVVRAPG